MTIRERPKQECSLDYKKPGSQREFAISDDTHAADKTIIQLYAMANTPLVDTGIDPTTGTAISLFRGTIKVTETGGGCWTATVPYESSTYTVELNFTLGVQSTKIYQALADVAGYNCLQTVSGPTLTLIDAASAAADVAQLAADAIAVAFATCVVDAAAAVTAANVAGVDATVKGFVLAAAAAATLTGTDSFNCEVAGGMTADAVQATAADVAAGNLPAAQADVFNASTFNSACSGFADQADTDSGTAEVAAAAAQTAAIGGNAQTIAAADAATVSADTAAAGLVAACLAAVAAADAADVAAIAAVAALQADIIPGGNNVPIVNGVIGDNGASVDGVEVEIGKVEFSITKRWSTAVISGAYFAVLADMTARTVVNDNTYTIVWQGQTLAFATGTLRFRGASIKWNSQQEVEITYHFVYERSIVAGDNFTVGASAVITKEGQQYLWVKYMATVSLGTVTQTPQAVYIQQVYPYDDLGKLQL